MAGISTEALLNGLIPTSAVFIAAAVVKVVTDYRVNKRLHQTDLRTESLTYEQKVDRIIRILDGDPSWDGSGLIAHFSEVEKKVETLWKGK